MSVMSAAASQASTRVPHSPADGKTLFGGIPMAVKGGPHAFVGEPVACEQPQPFMMRFPPTPMASTFGRSRSPVAYRLGGSATLPPMAQLASMSPPMTHRSSASPPPRCREAQACLAAPCSMQPLPGANPLLAQLQVQHTGRAPSSRGSPALDSARTSSRRAASQESGGESRLPGRAGPCISARAPSPMSRAGSHQSMPSMPIAKGSLANSVGTGGQVPVEIEVLPPSSARTKRPETPCSARTKRPETPKPSMPQQLPPQTQLAQPREPVAVAVQPPQMLSQPSAVPPMQHQQPRSVQSQPLQLQPQTLQVPATGGLQQLLPQTPLPSMNSLVQEGAAVTQLLSQMNEVMHVVKRLDGAKQERRQSATSTNVVGTPPVPPIQATPGSQDTTCEAAGAAEQWKSKYEQLVKCEEELQEQVRELCDRRDCLEAQTREQEREHANTARKAAEETQKLEDQKQALECELQMAKQSSQGCAALEKQLESLRLREGELSSHLKEAAQGTQRLQEEKQAANLELEATQEQLEGCRQMEQEMQQWRHRCQELERSDQDLQAQVRTVNSKKVTLVSQMEERERELASRVSAAMEQAQLAEAEKQAMQDETERAHMAIDQAKRHAQQAVEASREEVRDLQLQNGRLEEQVRQVVCEQEQQAGAAWSKRQVQELQQENASLRQAAEEHRTLAFQLECQLQQERALSANLAPGDFFRMMKTYEPESLCFENARLRTELQNAQSDREACQHTIAEQIALIKELHRSHQ